MMVSEDFSTVKLNREQSDHRFESVSYILDLYKGKLIEKLQGKRKCGKLQPKIWSDFDMPVWKSDDKKCASAKTGSFNMIGC